jgi:hypothetical protein
MLYKTTFYIYAYIRGTDSETAEAGTPYYIGKGKGRRAFENHGKVPVPKDKTLIVFLERQLTEIGAVALERRLIKWFGRKNTNTGILLNRTDGGEGISGAVRSAEFRQKMSALRAGSIQSAESNIKRSKTLTGKQKPQGHGEKVSAALTGRIRTPEHSLNLSKSHLRRIERMKTDGITVTRSLREVTCPYCNKIGKGGNMTRYHFNNCKQYA